MSIEHRNEFRRPARAGVVLRGRADANGSTPQSMRLILEFIRKLQGSERSEAGRGPGLLERDAQGVGSA